MRDDECQRRLLLALSKGNIKRIDAIVDVRHDSDCLYLVGLGRCCCDPWITVTQAGETFKIDRNGDRLEVKRRALH
jgi:hypothetical protein